jgi:hypothetical protein
MVCKKWYKNNLKMRLTALLFGPPRRAPHHQSMFEEYAESLRNDNPNDKQCHGRVRVSLDKSAVSSLWDEVQGLIEYSNAMS